MDSIDRNNRDDLLKQIGRTEEKIKHQQRLISKVDSDIQGWDKRRKHMKEEIENRGSKISKHQKYIEQLENDLNKIQSMKPIYKKEVFLKENKETYLVKRYLFGILIKTTEIITER